ncbi:MAG TPA: phage holin family protein [Chitinophagaceae bacterium]|jgi:4-amino-4-deoxy-L-arabinose transferase-like glycosyltransferase|nr:phage holin family protein [Chitinophagaceae bacterium]
MEELKASAQSLKTNVSEYVKTYIQITKAKATQGASNAASAVAVIIGALLFGMFFLQFIFLGLAWWIGEALDSAAAGFFIVAGFFLLLIILLFALRKKYISPLIRNAIIAIMYEQKEQPHVGDKN